MMPVLEPARLAMLSPGACKYLKIDDTYRAGCEAMLAGRRCYRQHGQYGLVLPECVILAAGSGDSFQRQLQTLW
jgi:hypothetical protein